MLMPPWIFLLLYSTLFTIYDGALLVEPELHPQTSACVPSEATMVIGDVSLYLDRIPSSQ